MVRNIILQVPKDTKLSKLIKESDSKLMNTGFETTETFPLDFKSYMPKQIWLLKQMVFWYTSPWKMTLIFWLKRTLMYS